MTTNSFGTALPRFDFPPEPVVVSRYARVAKFFPVAAIAATGVAAFYYINAPSQSTPVAGLPFPGASAMHLTQATPSQSTKQGADGGNQMKPKVDASWKPFS